MNFRILRTCVRSPGTVPVLQGGVVRLGRISGSSREMNAKRGPSLSLEKLLTNVLSALTALLWPAHLYAAPLSAIVSTSVHDTNADRGIITFPAQRSEGIALNDPFWVQTGEDRITWGSIFYIDDKGCAGRIAGGEVPAKGTSALIVRVDGMAAWCDGLPPETTLHATVQRAPPGRGTVWIDRGARSGLRVDDSMLIQRDSTPVARGRVAMIEEERALLVLTSLVSNARAEAGDRARLWPSPYDRRFGRVDSIILDVQEEDDTIRMRFVAAHQEGLHVHRVGDIYRGRNFIAVAEVKEVGYPLSRAEIDSQASMRERPQVGDRLVLRPSPPRRDIPMQAAVFLVRRVEGEPHDYALVAAGERDGVEVGDRFVVMHRLATDPLQSRRIAELVVDKVNVGYCGAEVRDDVPGDDERVQAWDIAERTKPAAPRWEPMGVVTAVTQEARVGWADVDDRVALQPGERLRWEADPEQPEYAAIVLGQKRQRVLLWVPPGWGPIQRLHHAGVDVEIKPSAKP